MRLAVRQPRHAMVHPSGQVADFGMQRRAERDAHLLKAAADAEQRHAARNAALNQAKCQRVAVVVVGLVARIGLGAETGRMYIGARPGEQNAVDNIEQCVGVGDLRGAGKHQRQGAGDFGHSAQNAFADPLRGKPVLDAVRAADNADNGLFGLFGLFRGHSSALGIVYPVNAVDIANAAASSAAIWECRIAASAITWRGRYEAGCCAGALSRNPAMIESARAIENLRDGVSNAWGLCGSM